MKDTAKSVNSKTTVDSLCKQIKVMRPGNVMSFIAKQLGMGSTEFILKNIHKIAGLAIKNGWIKTKDIGSAIAKFGEKNKEDNTGIDFSKLKIDPSTTQFKCLFDGDAGKQIQNFMSTFEAEIKDEGKEIEKADAQLHKDVKRAGIDMDEQEIDDNGLAVASVIDNRKNKDKKGKELKKEIENAIKKDEQAKEIQKISKEMKKSSSKVKVDKKYQNMSDEELAKLDDKINKKLRNRSEASKKNDAFRNKIKSAIQNGISSKFKKSVKTAYVSTNALKKTIAKNMKSGLAVEQIEEPRAVCISVQCGKKDFSNILKEAKDDSSAKIIDVTNGSKDKNIQKVIDYIKNVLQEKIGKDKLGNKTYAYLKNSNGNCLLYVFAGVKQDELDESLINEDSLDDDKDVNAAINAVKHYSDNKDALKILKASLETKTQVKDAALAIAAKMQAEGRHTADISTAIRYLRGAKGFPKGVAANAFSRQIAMLANAKSPDELASTAKSIGCSKNMIVELMSGNLSDGIYNSVSTAETVAHNAADATKATNTVTKISKLDKIEDDLHSIRDEQFSERGFATYSDGRIMPAFSYEKMSHDITSLNDMFADGKLDPNEIVKLNDFGGKLKEYSKWAAENTNSDDPLVKQKIAMISMLSKKYNDTITNGQSLFNSTEAQVSNARIGATEATRAASKEMANDEEVKKAASGWKEKLGLDKAFTALGWARLAAKSTGIILNNGKAVVDALGAAAMKFKEDSNVIAQMNFILSNSDDSDSKFNDTKFSVRFSTDDFKWHATCLDDRKMKFPEDVVIKKALDSAEGKKFKKVCLRILSSIFNPNDKIGKIIPFIMRKYEQLGIKPDKGDASKMIKTVEKIEGNFDKIKEAFK